MAVLENIRTKFGLAISIIIALALLSFIIDPATVENAFAAMSSKNDIGNIAGKSVSQEEFQAAEENFNNVYQMQTGSQASSEQDRKYVRDMAWGSLLSKYLFIPAAERAGLKVGPAEMVDLTSGDHVLPIFQSMFAGEDGNFSKDNLVNFLETLDDEGREPYKAYWNTLQEEVKAQQYQGKYTALLAASDAVSPLSARNRVKENNETAEIEFVSVPYSLGLYGDADSTVTVKDSEIKAYYNAHKKIFTQQASRDIEYVVFEVRPSAEDIAAAQAAMDEAYATFSTTDNLKTFLSYSNNSEMRWSTRWYKDGELNSVCRDVNKFVFEDGKGVSPIYRDGNAWYAARVVAARQMPESVSIDYIVLADGEGVAELADSLAGRVRAGDDFQTLVAMYSANKRESTASFTQPDDVPEFAKIFQEPVGQTSVIAANNAHFVIRVKEKGANVLKKQVAILKKSANPSDVTFKDKYAEAAEFAALAAGSTENYRKAVDSLSRKYAIYSQPLTVREDTENYGSVSNAKELTRWVFGAKPGKVSDIVTVENKYYFIATVKAVHKEGTPTLKEVSDDIRNMLYAQKSGAAKAAEVASKIEGLTDMEAIAKALDVTVSKQENVRFGALADRSTDPSLVGAVSAATTGNISRPVVGSMPFVYVFRVVSRDTDAHYTDDDARSEQVRKNQMVANNLLNVMMQDASVKDNRARFF